MLQHLLHLGSKIVCIHDGQATPISTIPRVTLSNMPIIVQPIPHTIVGCKLSSNAGGPCVTAQWVSASTRITSLGLPVLLMNSLAVASPTGALVKPVNSQKRVTGV